MPDGINWDSAGLPVQSNDDDGDASRPAANYARNKEWVRPGVTDFQTKLSPPEEKRFQTWMRDNKVPFEDDGPQSDYDMRGYWKTSQDKAAWKALQKGGSVPNDMEPGGTKIDPNDGKPHFPDWWKTPYHETFSDQSQYALHALAPSWKDDETKLVAPDGTVLFDDKAQKPKEQQPGAKPAQSAQQPAAQPAVDWDSAGAAVPPEQNPIDAPWGTTPPTMDIGADIKSGVRQIAAMPGNIASDPFGNIFGKPIAAGIQLAHDALAPVFGYQRFPKDVRDMLLGDNVPQPGTRVVDAAAHVLGVPDEPLPQTDADVAIRKATAGTLGGLTVGGPLGAVVGGLGAVAGHYGVKPLPDWAQPAAEDAVNLGAGIAAAKAPGLVRGPGLRMGFDDPNAPQPGGPPPGPSPGTAPGSRPVPGGAAGEAYDMWEEFRRQHGWDPRTESAPKPGTAGPTPSGGPARPSGGPRVEPTTGKPASGASGGAATFKAGDRVITPDGIGTVTATTTKTVGGQSATTHTVRFDRGGTRDWTPDQLKAPTSAQDDQTPPSGEPGVKPAEPAQPKPAAGPKPKTDAGRTRATQVQNVLSRIDELTRDGEPHPENEAGVRLAKFRQMLKETAGKDGGATPEQVEQGHLTEGQHGAVQAKPGDRVTFFHDERGEYATGNLVGTRPNGDHVVSLGTGPYKIVPKGKLLPPRDAAEPTEPTPAPSTGEAPASNSATETPASPPAPSGVRTTSQIQREDGVGHNQAVKTQEQEKQAAAQQPGTTDLGNAPNGPWEPAGKNEDGDTVYKNPQGVHAVNENGVPYSEATQDGKPLAPDARKPRFTIVEPTAEQPVVKTEAPKQTAEEPAQEPAQEAKPKQSAGEPGQPRPRLGPESPPINHDEISLSKLPADLLPIIAVMSPDDRDRFETLMKEEHDWNRQAGTPGQEFWATPEEEARRNAVGRELGDIFDRNAAKVQAAAPPAPKPTAATPAAPKGRTVYSGSGRTDQASVYNPLSAATPIAGPGKYWAFTEADAKTYGPNVETGTLDLQKPLVITSDEQWRALTKRAGWSVPNPVGKPKATVEADTKRLKDIVTGDGHDGIVFDWDDSSHSDQDEKTGNWIKLLRDVIGHPQAVDYRPAKAAPAVPAAPAASAQAHPPIDNLPPGYRVQFKRPVDGSTAEGSIVKLTTGPLGHPVYRVKDAERGGPALWIDPKNLTPIGPASEAPAPGAPAAPPSPTATPTAPPEPTATTEAPTPDPWAVGTRVRLRDGTEGVIGGPPGRNYNEDHTLLVPVDAISDQFRHYVRPETVRGMDGQVLPHPEAKAKPATKPKTKPLGAVMPPGDKYYPPVHAGEQLWSKSGREMSPVPNFTVDTNRAQNIGRRKLDDWLLTEANREAAANSDHFMTRHLAGLDAKNFSPSDRDTAIEVLWGNGIGPKPEHRTAPAAEPTPAAAPAPVAAPEPAAQPRNPEVDRLAQRYGVPTEGRTDDQILDALADKMSPAEAALVGRKLDKERQAAYDDAEKAALDWILYHGTPHLFDRFDLSKIGSGEGHQAYGWGLYMAENRDVADFYRAGVIPPEFKRRRDELRKAYDAAMDAWSAKQGTVTIRDLANNPSLAAEYRAETARLEKAAIEAKDRWAEYWQGQLYTVAVKGRPEEFLDWDRPLAEQSQFIRDKFASLTPADLGLEPHPSGRLFRKPGIQYVSKAGDRVFAKVPAEVQSVADLLEGNGKDIYEQFRTLSPDDSPQGGSEALRKIGIKGIRYLDGASRSGGEGTRNVVVFSDKDVEITHRNGEKLTQREKVYDQPQDRPLEDLENEQQANAAPAAQQRPPGDEQSGPAGEDQEPVSDRPPEGGGDAGVGGGDAAQGDQDQGEVAADPFAGHVTRPDGRLYPQVGDKVYQTVPGFGGTPATIHGEVYGSSTKPRVRTTGSSAVFGSAQTGKTYQLDGNWTVVGDPEIKRREDARAKEEADRKAAYEAEIAAHHAALDAAAKERGTLDPTTVKLGDVIEQPDGTKQVVGEIGKDGTLFVTDFDDLDGNPRSIGDMRGVRKIDEPPPEGVKIDDTDRERDSSGGGAWKQRIGGQWVPVDWDEEKRAYVPVVEPAAPTAPLGDRPAAQRPVSQAEYDALVTTAQATASMFDMNQRDPKTEREKLDRLRQNRDDARAALDAVEKPPEIPDAEHNDAVALRQYQEGGEPTPDPGNAYNGFSPPGVGAVQGRDSAGHEWGGTGHALVRLDADKGFPAMLKRSLARKSVKHRTGLPESAVDNVVNQSGADTPITWKRNVSVIGGKTFTVGQLPDGTPVVVEKSYFDVEARAAGPGGSFATAAPSKTDKQNTSQASIAVRNAAGETVGVLMPIRQPRRTAMIWATGQVPGAGGGQAAAPTAPKPPPPAPPQAAAPAAVTGTTTGPFPEWATKYEPDVGGRVIYADPEVALLEGYSILHGRPVYLGVSNEKNSRTLYDIDSFKGDIFTPAQTDRLKAAKAEAATHDQAAFDAHPDGPFAPGAKIAHSRLIKPSVAALATEWLNMLGLGDKRVFIADPRDVTGDAGDAYNLHGPYAAIRSAGVDRTEGGSMRRLSNGDYYIALAARPRLSATLETLAHEIGHIVEREMWKDAPQGVKDAAQAAFNKFLDDTKGQTAPEYVKNLRAHTLGKLTAGNVGTGRAEDLGHYWRSFSEWFADQVSKWATTDGTARTKTDQMFAKIGAAQKRLAESATGGRYLPADQMRQWLNAKAALTDGPPVTEDATPIAEDEAAPADAAEPAGEPPAPTPAAEPEVHESWAPEVHVDGKWSGNSLRFATKEEAEASALDLFSRWTMTKDHRAVESTDPVSHRWDKQKGSQPIEAPANTEEAAPPPAVTPAPPEPPADSGFPASGGPDDPLLVNNLEHLRQLYGPDGLMARVVAQMLHEFDTGDRTQPLAIGKLQEAATMIYGGSMAAGGYTRDRLYDAIETGVNLYVLNNGDAFDPRQDLDQAKQAAERLAKMKDMLPTQTVRAGEKDTLQQFSTPPDYAFTAAWVANLRLDDHVLEPTAGNGGLAVHAMTAGVAEVTGNELSEQRRTMMQTLPFTRITGENAEQLHNILPPSVKPTVVIMNPPFSSAGDRMGGKRVLETGAVHIEQALKRLQKGGRLVAIVGRGMSLNAPTYRAWWKRMGDFYDVRANVGVDGLIYRKYGTNFGTRLLVIDKVKPSGRPVVEGDVDSAPELIDLLAGVRNERPEGSASEPVAGQPGGPPLAGGGQGAGQPAGSVRGPTGGVGAGVGQTQPAGDVGTQPTNAGSRPSGNVRSGTGGGVGGNAGNGAPVQQPQSDQAGGNGQPAQQPVGSGRPAGSSGSGGAGGVRPDRGDNPDGTGVTPPPAGARPPTERVENQAINEAPDGGELTENVYEPYKPQRIQIAGAQPHPGDLVQSAAMASVLPPIPKYQTAIPKALITSGALSAAQLEAVVYAGSAHDQMLEPAGEGIPAKRRGFFIGDGTGVGKGREVAGIILDNRQQGRKLAVWVSEKMDLANDAKRDWTGLDQNKADILPQNKVKAGDVIKHDGILFTTYDTLRSGEKFDTSKLTPGMRVTAPTTVGRRAAGVLGPMVTGGAYRVDFDDGTSGSSVPAKNIKPEAGGGAKTRVQQIVEWLGPDFDGVIAFDEAHNMGNAIASRGNRGVKEAAGKALAGLELQNALPNARVVYVSATGATEVSNLAYADRLGLWGRGTAFSDRSDFLNKIAFGGVAAMELVARDMKALGLYTARSLSYDGVEYGRLQHDLTPAQSEMYDKLAEAWQMVLQRIDQALETTDATGKGGPKAAIRSAFWGGHQRFFNQLITSLQMPTVLKSIERDIAEGRQAVLQLVNTNESGQERALNKARANDAEDLEDLDMSPRDQLIQLVDKVFPTQQYEKYVDDDGNERTRPVVDSEGQPVHNPDAIAAKEELLMDLGSIRVPDGPLEILVNHFGPDVIAEVTGRKQRVVRRPDKSGHMKTVLEKRGDAANDAEAKAFQTRKKKVLVFSEAGGTGRSYHDAKDAVDHHGIGSNSARRSHYLVQAGWRADKAVQGFGRSHRTNQWSAPIFHLVTTNLEGQKRFISSIARRLGQLGALTRGERKTGDQGLFGRADNLESDEAKAGLKQLFRDIYRGDVEGFTTQDLVDQMGLDIVDHTTGGLKFDLPPMTQFLNRILSLRVVDQNRVFQAFSQRYQDALERATADGTLDTGTETYRADKIVKKSEQVVYTDPNSGAKTKHVHFESSHRNDPSLFDKVMAGDDKRTGFRAPMFFVVNNRSGRISAISHTTYEKTEADGVTTQYYVRSTPMTRDYVERQKIDNADPDQFTRITDVGQARTMWDQQVAKVPEFRTQDLHMITGAILPIWDRLGGYPQIYRLQTDDGERFLGRTIDNENIVSTLERLGAEAAGSNMPPATVIEQVFDGGTARLANGWTIRRSRVAGEVRLELRGSDLYSHIAELTQSGVFRERFGTDTRFFIPTGERGIDALTAIMQRRPLVGVSRSGD